MPINSPIWWANVSFAHVSKLSSSFSDSSLLKQLVFFFFTIGFLFLPIAGEEISSLTPSFNNNTLRSSPCVFFFLLQTSGSGRWQVRALLRNTSEYTILATQSRWPVVWRLFKWHFPETAVGYLLLLAGSKKKTEKNQNLKLKARCVVCGTFLWNLTYICTACSSFTGSEWYLFSTNTSGSLPTACVGRPPQQVFLLPSCHLLSLYPVGARQPHSIPLGAWNFFRESCLPIFTRLNLSPPVVMLKFAPSRVFLPTKTGRHQAAPAETWSWFWSTSVSFLDVGLHHWEMEHFKCSLPIVQQIFLAMHLGLGRNLSSP